MIWVFSYDNILCDSYYDFSFMPSQQLVLNLQDFIQNFGTWLIIAILLVNHQLRRPTGKIYIITNMINIVVNISSIIIFCSQLCNFSFNTFLDIFLESQVYWTLPCRVELQERQHRQPGKWLKLFWHFRYSEKNLSKLWSRFRSIWCALFQMGQKWTHYQ